MWYEILKLMDWLLFFKHSENHYLLLKKPFRVLKLLDPNREGSSFKATAVFNMEKPKLAGAAGRNVVTDQSEHSQKIKSYFVKAND